MSLLSTPFTELVGIDHPIVQDGMGPFNTARLAAAVSSAGGLGTVSMPGMTLEPDEADRTIRAQIETAAESTDRPFAVNVPVGRDASGSVLPISAVYIEAVLDMRHKDAGLADQLRVLTTSAGFPGEFRGAIADSGITHMHKVGSTHHAIKACESGVDVIIASGYEMGGHTHETPVHTFVLAPNVTAAVDVPVLLSGGARDGATLAAALCLGAAGVAMGTRFIASHDNEDWHPAYRERVLAAREGDDVVFPAVYGPARGLRTHGVRELERLLAEGRLTEAEITRWKDDAMKRAQRLGEVEEGLVPAGQVASALTDLISVAEFVPRAIEEAVEILTSLARTTSYTTINRDEKN